MAMPQRPVGLDMKLSQPNMGLNYPLGLLNHTCQSFFLLISTRIMERKYQCELGIMALGIFALGIMALGKLSCNRFFNASRV